MSLLSKKTLLQLHLFLNQFTKCVVNENLQELNQFFYDRLNSIIKSEKKFNGWFEPEMIKKALKNISKALKEKHIDFLLKKYAIQTPKKSKTIALILPGNIPAVGFFDFISVLLSGHKVLVKCSSKDSRLISLFSDILIYLQPDLSKMIKFESHLLKNFDAVIATGNDNSARYFNYYFNKYPHIIRKNRTSVAVIDNTTKTSDLEKLTEDIFSYFGLGCRNVSKIFISKDLKINTIIPYFQKYKILLNSNNKYMNNYDYYKSIYLIENESFIDSEFCILKKSDKVFSPVSVIYFEEFNNYKNLNNLLKKNKDNIQCIVGNNPYLNKNSDTINFGESQKPMIWNFADGIDTFKFLKEL